MMLVSNVLDLSGGATRADNADGSNGDTDRAAIPVFSGASNGVPPLDFGVPGLDKQGK